MAVGNAGKAVLPPTRLVPSRVAILATSITGEPVSVDSVRRALRDGLLRGRCVPGTTPAQDRWTVRYKDAVAWAEARRDGKV